jgi:glutathione S-transferase
VLRLITIPISHYCEKARWALDRARLPYRELRHVQVFHYLPARLAGGGATVPVLIVDARRTLRDSTEILAWVDERTPGSLLPLHPGARAEVLRLEEHFDVELGPATRRVVYFNILGHKELLHYNGAGTPFFERFAVDLGFSLVGQFISRRLRITPERIPDDLARIRAVFDEVGGRIAGRRYLVGDRFTAADLTFASMAAPMLLPDEYGTRLPGRDEAPPALRELVDEFRGHPAGAYALRLFREDRRAPDGA